MLSALGTATPLGIQYHMNTWRMLSALGTATPLGIQYHASLICRYLQIGEFSSEMQTASFSHGFGEQTSDDHKEQRWQHRCDARHFHG